MKMRTWINEFQHVCGVGFWHWVGTALQPYFGIYGGQGVSWDCTGTVYPYRFVFDTVGLQFLPLTTSLNKHGDYASYGIVQLDFSLITTARR
jgi:hypothetical protein